MAYVAVNKAVASVVMAAKLEAVKDLITYLDSKIDIDEEMKGILDSFMVNLKGSEEKVVKTAGKKTTKGKKSASDSDEPKKKRAPSVFNLYVKDVMPMIKAKHPEIKDGKVMMGMASASWKTDPMGSFIKEKMLEMKKEDKDGDVVVMFAKAKAMYVVDVASDEEDAVEEEKPVEKKKAPKKGKKVIIDEKVVDEEEKQVSDEEKDHVSDEE
jgi:hypothetical protein